MVITKPMLIFYLSLFLLFSQSTTAYQINPFYGLTPQIDRSFGDSAWSFNYGVDFFTIDFDVIRLTEPAMSEILNVTNTSDSKVMIVKIPLLLENEDPAIERWEIPNCKPFIRISSTYETDYPETLFDDLKDTICSNDLENIKRNLYEEYEFRMSFVFTSNETPAYVLYELSNERFLDALISVHGFRGTDRAIIRDGTTIEIFEYNGSYMYTFRIGDYFYAVQHPYLLDKYAEPFDIFFGPSTKSADDVFISSTLSELYEYGRSYPTEIFTSQRFRLYLWIILLSLCIFVWTLFDLKNKFIKGSWEESPNGVIYSFFYLVVLVFHSVYTKAFIMGFIPLIEYFCSILAISFIAIPMFEYFGFREGVKVISLLSLIVCFAGYYNLLIPVLVFAFSFILPERLPTHKSVVKSKFYRKLGKKLKGVR